MRDNPLSWYDVNGSGIKSGSITILGHGNSKILSIIHVFIQEKDMLTTWCDRYRLEKAISEWYKNIPLEHLT